MAKIDISEVTASSFYKSEAFGPGNLIDGNKEFGGWITDVAASQNAWIEFRFGFAGAVSFSDHICIARNRCVFEVMFLKV